MTTGLEGPLLIYTDACHDVAESVGSWGVVLRWDDGEEIHARAFKGSCPTTIAAEAQGLVNALHIAIARGLIWRGREVVIYCDNKSVVDYVNREITFKPKTCRAAKVALRAAMQIIAEWPGCTWRVRWIRSHQPIDRTDCQHARGNHLADAAARDAMPNAARRLEAKRAARKARKKRWKARRLERLAAESAKGAGQ